MSKIKLLTASLLLSFLAHSQQDRSNLNGDSTVEADLTRVVITANKFPRKQALSGKVVTVIGRTVLDRSSGKTLTEILNQQAGLTVIGAQNSLGTNQDVYMRGASLGRTLILVDGIPVYDPSSPTTAFDLNTISLENVEQVEILKGAQSTLYGSDAVAGVINIITRKAGAKKVSPFLTLAGGSYDTYKAAAGLSGREKLTTYNVQYMHLRSAGFSSAHENSGLKTYDHDGFNQNAFNASIGTAITKNFNVRLHGQYSRYRTDLDLGAFLDERDYTTTVKNHAAGAASTLHYKKGILFFNYQYNRLNRKYLDDSTHVGGFYTYVNRDYRGSSHFAEVFTKYEAVENLVEVLAGVDFRQHQTDQDNHTISSFGEGRSGMGGDSTQSRQYSVFLSGLLQTEAGLYLELGGRANHHSEYGSNFTYTFNPAYMIRSKVKLFANVASAYKVPAPYQLFDPMIGEKALKPEQSRTVEAGVQVFPAKNYMARLVYFDRNIKNGIDYNYTTNKYFNYNRQEDHGLEAEISINEGPLVITGNYTYVTGKVNALNFIYNPATWGYEIKGDTSYNNLFRRPKHSINATAGFHATPQLFISFTGKWIGKRMEPVFASAPIEMDSYATLDIFTEYQFGKGLKIFLDLKNILDEEYFDVMGYNTRRFNSMTGITYRIN